MAGEMEQPYSHKFQADTLHSGSISFGRFQGELFAWEHRSSFSHNRYLEEVQQCSKPGFVIARKAYFEEHFKRKALLRQSSKDNNGEEARSGEDNLSGKDDDKGETSAGNECGSSQIGGQCIESTNVLPNLDLIGGLTVTEPVRSQIFSIDNPIETHKNDNLRCISETFEHSDVELGTEIGTECENNQVKACEDDDEGCITEPLIYSELDNTAELGNECEACVDDVIHCITEPFKHPDIGSATEIVAECENTLVDSNGDDDGCCITKFLKRSGLGSSTDIDTACEDTKRVNAANGESLNNPECSSKEDQQSILYGNSDSVFKNIHPDSKFSECYPSLRISDFILDNSGLGSATDIDTACEDAKWVNAANGESLNNPECSSNEGQQSILDGNSDSMFRNIHPDSKFSECYPSLRISDFVLDNSGLGSATDIDTACEDTKWVNAANDESLNNPECSSHEDQQSILDGNSDCVFRNIHADSKFSECYPSLKISDFILDNSDKDKGNPMHEILFESEDEQNIEVKQTVTESVHKKDPHDNDFSKKNPEDKIYDIPLDNHSLPSFKPLLEIKSPKINWKSLRNVREAERSTIGLNAWPTMNTTKKVVDASRTKMPKKPSQNHISSANLLCRSLKADGSLLNHGRSNHTSKPEVRRSVATFNFRSDERAEKRKEFFLMLEQKVHEKQALLQHMEAQHKERADAEMKQYRRSLNFKANPMPSFYREAARQCSVKQGVAGNVSTKVGSRSSTIVSKPLNGRTEGTPASSKSCLTPNNEKARPRSSVRGRVLPHKVDSKNGGR